MAAYDPFSRGPHPVGVRTYDFTDHSRDRALTIECWHPAAESARGRDLDRETQDRFNFMPGFPKAKQTAVRDVDPADGRFPLVIFSHGFAGHRRQTSHFCCHLASHGYLVASPDHAGNTMADILELVTKAKQGQAAPDPAGLLAGWTRDRPLDVSRAIDAVLAGELGGRADPLRIGMTGHSYGGLTTLLATRADQRIKASLPLAPGGGKSKLHPEANLLGAGLALDWDRAVPLLYLVADLDSLLPLDGMEDLFRRTPEPRDMIILENADHFHFCDSVEATHNLFRKMGGMAFGLGDANRPDPMARSKPSSELIPGKLAYDFLRGIGLTHLDAHLKDLTPAQDLLRGDVKALLAGRGIEVEVVRG